MHTDLEWAIARNAQTAAERGEPLPPAAVCAPSSRNAFEQLAAIGEHHGRPLQTAPLTANMRLALALAHDFRTSYIDRAWLAKNIPSPWAALVILRGLARRQLGEVVVSGGYIIGLRLNDSGKREAARLVRKGS
jgi:hypothetical protein